MGAWGLGSDEDDGVFNLLDGECALPEQGKEGEPAYDPIAFYAFLEKTPLEYDYLSDVGMIVYAVRNEATFSNLPAAAVASATRFLEQELAELTCEPVKTIRKWDPRDYPERIKKIREELALLKGYAAARGHASTPAP